ncbi:Oidioi.mRNA.OKI2018_I69.XSR.g16026.t1.cds [Oikopleura dioica]|uniref:Oidioi.mRNA.OKI2018_I69.XSR.g16026.t1.cds n=1 Tax=Oikopleura dioica TaxID=34765 RepID=A0ABN7SGM3_OIKDI|nr:Oidioi.mRNA.OKI2018_I69.XSR.g16026.t1.cds [Oikopleura dioica]
MASSGHTSTFRGIKYLGSVEIIRSLYNIPKPLRTDIIGFAINRILQRYSRSNFWLSHSETETSVIHPYVGRSPMSKWHQHICDLHLSSDRIIVNANDGRDITRVFDHPLANVSVAAKDICIPNLWCYVSRSSSTFGSLPERRLFLFECIDILQASKLHDLNLQRFSSQQSAPSSKTLCVQLPPRPHPTSTTSSPPPLPPRKSKPTTDERYLKFV